MKPNPSPPSSRSDAANTPSAAASGFGRRIEQIRHGRPPGAPDPSAVGSFLPEWYRREVQRPMRALTAVSESWVRVVPAGLVERTILLSFTRGVLTVAVPNAVTGYELERFLAEGGQDLLRRSLTTAAAFQRVRVKVEPSRFGTITRR